MSVKSRTLAVFGFVGRINAKVLSKFGYGAGNIVFGSGTIPLQTLILYGEGGLIGARVGVGKKIHVGGFLQSDLFLAASIYSPYWIDAVMNPHIRIGGVIGDDAEINGVMGSCAYIEGFTSLTEV